MNKHPLSVAAAESRILKAVSPVGSELTCLSDAFGRVLAENLMAKCSNPQTSVSAMDGIAVRHGDIKSGAVLTLVGESTAGGTAPTAIQSGEAMRIFTGAMLPQGADTVIIQENIRIVKDKVTVLEKGGKKGDYVRQGGLDFKKGDRLADKGAVLSVRLVAMLLAAGHVWVPTYRRPQMLILSSGNELVMPGEGRDSGGVIAGNAITLRNFATMFGCDARILPITADSRKAILAAAKQLHSADVIVASGGASVGDYDLLRPVLQECGLRLDFYKIAMRPGKPMMFGGFNGIPYLGLPGNPVSVLVCAVVFLRALLLKLAGVTPMPLREIPAKLLSPLPKEGTRQHYMRAAFHYKKDTLWVQPAANQDSSLLAASASADGFIVRPPADPAKKKGQVVKVVAFPDSLLRY